MILCLLEDRVTRRIYTHAVTMRVYQISVSLREVVICRVSDLFRFRAHAAIHGSHSRRNYFHVFFFFFFYPKPIRLDESGYGTFSDFKFQIYLRCAIAFAVNNFVRSYEINICVKLLPRSSFHYKETDI